MQDVCISFWKEDGKSDMMVKVTDICDPAECVTPADIKVVRTKVQTMEGLTGKPLSAQPQLTGDQFPEKTWWFFTKCWADVWQPFLSFYQEPFLFFKLPKSKLITLLVSNRVSHNPPTKVRRPITGSQLLTFPTTSNGR